MRAPPGGGPAGDSVEAPHIKMPKEKPLNLWAQTLKSQQLARDTALLQQAQQAGGRKAKLAKAQELRAKALTNPGSALAKPSTTHDMLSSLDDILAAEAAKPKPRAKAAARASAEHRAALELHTAYAGGAGNPLAALRKHISSL